MEKERTRFEALFKSVFRNKFNLIRTYTGYEDAFVNSCFFFWQEGKQ